MNYQEICKCKTNYYITEKKTNEKTTNKIMYNHIMSFFFIMYNIINTINTYLSRP